MGLRYRYVDERGHRSNALSEEDLRLLALRGVLTPDGTVELEADEPLDAGPGVAPPRILGKVREIGWLAALLVPPPTSPAPLPPALPLSPAALPLTSLATTSDWTRTNYVLLALLPAFLGVFGIGNVLIGRLAVGIVQLVLSIFTISGCAFGSLAFPCACVGVPLYLALLVWTVVEVVVVETDARGRRLR